MMSFDADCFSLASIGNKTGSILTRDKSGQFVNHHSNKKIEAMLLESEHELKRRGAFKLIFPFANAQGMPVYKALFGAKKGYTHQSGS